MSDNFIKAKRLDDLIAAGLISGKKVLMRVDFNVPINNGKIESDIRIQAALPSIKKVNFKSDILNKSLRLNVSNSAMRSIDKKGSFDQFMKEVKSKYLSDRLKKVKKSILQKSA